MRRSLLYISFFCILLISKVTSFYNIISFAKQLQIPGKLFSMMNFSKNTQLLQNYYDVNIDYSLSQAVFSDQSNSIYDFFLFDRANYAVQEPCYSKAVIGLNELYNQQQPCQGGCNVFEAVKNYSQNYTYLSFTSQQYNNISLIIDNTFYPCNGGGAYHKEVYLYQVINLTIEENTSYLLIVKIVFMSLLLVFIFLFAYIVIMLQKLQNKKKKLKKNRQQEEDMEVLFSLERDRQNN